MMRGTKAQRLVVGKRPRYIRHHEDRLHTDNTSHTEIIRVVAYLSESWRDAESSAARSGRIRARGASARYHDGRNAAEQRRPEDSVAGSCLF
jgi:hypothetical protein